MKKILWIMLGSTLSIANLSYANTSYPNTTTSNNSTTNYSVPHIAPVTVSDPMAPFKKSGFYVGAGIGSSYLNYHTITTEGGNSILNNTNYGNGVLGILQAGYQYICCKFALSIDGFANINSQRTNTYTFYSANGDSRNMQYANTWNAGISLLPGYMFNDYLIAYLRLGYINSHYTVNTQGGPNSSFSKNVPGGQIGLGGEIWFPMLGNFSVRGEFDSVISSTWNNIGTFTSAAGATENARVKMANNMFQINFIYHFV